MALGKLGVGLTAAAGGVVGLFIGGMVGEAAGHPMAGGLIGVALGAGAAGGLASTKPNGVTATTAAQVTAANAAAQGVAALGQ